MSDTAHGGNPYKIYIWTWVALLIITVAMLVAEKFDMPRWFLLVFLLFFMAVKAVMIGANFMHLKFEKTNLQVVVATGLVVTTLILFFFITPEAGHVREKTTAPLPAPAAPAAHH
jgi:cytochrome c oxidase subunit IV